jgi:dTDP-4-amino-4,6-dideoxygalactose transaminase
MELRLDWPARGHEFTEEEIQAVATVMRSKKAALTQGLHVAKFEKDFAAYLNSSNAFALMSAAHGLDIAAMLIDIKQGDEVIIPAHTYCASALAFARRGAKIQWADIDPATFTVSIDSVKKLITEKTKAIVVVHLYGLISPDIEKFVTLAKNKNLFLIEDCAQSLGAKLNGKHCGTFGDIGCYSFHAQKNLTTLGEGGVITVADPEMAKKVTGLRLNGHAPFQNKPEYWLPAMINVDEDMSDVWPIKSTMNEPQAAVASLITTRMDDLTSRRRKRGMQFREALQDFPELEFQFVYKDEAHSHHLLPARCTSAKWQRDDLIRLLYNDYGVKAIIQFYPLYRYDLFKKKGLGYADVPETDRFFDNMISFPFSLIIEDEEFAYLIDSVKAAILKLNSSK